MILNKKPTTYFLLVGVLLALTLLAFSWYHYWPQMLLYSNHLQGDLYQKIGTLFYQIKEQKSGTAIYFIGFSFIYGLLHSLGPGHGKFIVSSYLLTHPSHFQSSLYVTICGAFLQALTAIGLVFVGKYVFAKSMHLINAQAIYLTHFSFYFLIAFGVFMLWQIAYYYYKGDKHVRSACSCCAHVDPAKIPHSHALPMILSIGLRPCSGALMVLLFATSLQLYWLGILSALLMAFGTAITTSVLAWLTISGKKIVALYQINKATKTPSLINYPLLFKTSLALFFIVFGYLLLESTSVQVRPFF